MKPLSVALGVAGASKTQEEAARFGLLRSIERRLILPTASDLVTREEFVNKSCYATNNLCRAVAVHAGFRLRFQTGVGS